MCTANVSVKPILQSVAWLYPTLLCVFSEVASSTIPHGGSQTQGMPSISH